MPLVKDGRIVEDRFVQVLDDGPLPEGAPVLLPAPRFLADHAELAMRGAPVGVIWPNSSPVAELAPHLQQLALVALVFPTFKDGRAYSQARLLREKYGYRRELRATGDVLQDQFQFLLRAGFDSFEVAKPEDAERFEAAARRHTVFYQPAADNALTILQQRLRRRGQAAREPERTP